MKLRTTLKISINITNNKYFGLKLIILLHATRFAKPSLFRDIYEQHLPKIMKTALCKQFIFCSILIRNVHTASNTFYTLN